MTSGVQGQLDHLKVAADGVRQWSRDMRDELSGQNQRVEVFVSEELRKDVPTGMLFPLLNYCHIWYKFPLNQYFWSSPRAKTINVFRACLGAQLTICAQK